MIPTQLEQVHKDHWNSFASLFDMTTNEGCGKYTEHWIVYAQGKGWTKVGHLKKNPGQTQYNGHANDAFLYADGTGNEGGLFQAVDIIGAAESTDPTNPPRINWGVDIPRYTIKDWLQEPNANPVPPSNMVPWVPYDEQKFQFLKRQLAYDYARRPQGPDFDVSVWSARTLHNTYFGPEGTPLGEVAGLERAQKEWSAALGVPVKKVPDGWNIGDPV